ncbi:MAG: D-hexose-6-phosphate mutarotase [Betaproteobacteria bacterium]|nr:D-hexose-6-phosphate mutarotase [Betaproteobacteria bacterium]
MNNSPGLRIGELQGIPVLLVEAREGRAAVSLFGGQILSYAPAGFDDLLWVSRTTTRPPKAIRGGVPICWPWFAKQGVPPESQQHGIARTAPWTLTRSAIDVNGNVEITLAPNEDSFPAARVEQTVSVGRALRQVLTTTALRPYSLTQAFHTYFRVGDAERIGIEGLDGLTYLDKPSDFSRRVQTEMFRLDGECDRIYLDTQGDFAIHDPVLSRRIRIRAKGSRSLVVWNPNAERIKTFADIPPDGWRSYLCLEVANAGTDTVNLGPGASHRIEQALSAESIR